MVGGLKHTRTGTGTTSFPPPPSSLLPTLSLSLLLLTLSPPLRLLPSSLSTRRMEGNTRSPSPRSALFHSKGKIPSFFSFIPSYLPPYLPPSLPCHLTHSFEGRWHRNQKASGTLSYGGGGYYQGSFDAQVPVLFPLSPLFNPLSPSFSPLLLISSPSLLFFRLAYIRDGNQVVEASRSCQTGTGTKVNQKTHNINRERDLIAPFPSSSIFPSLPCSFAPLDLSFSFRGSPRHPSRPPLSLSFEDRMSLLESLEYYGDRRLKRLGLLDKEGKPTDWDSFFDDGIA